MSGLGGRARPVEPYAPARPHASVHATSAVITLALGLPDAEQEELVDEAVVLGQGYLRQVAR